MKFYLKKKFLNLFEYFHNSKNKQGNNNYEIGQTNNQEKDTEIYRNIIKNMQDIYFRSNLKGNLIMVSPAIESILGYTPQEAVGNDIANKFYKYPEERKDLLNKLQKTGEVNNFEVTLLTKKGKSVHMLSNSHFIYDKKKKPVGIEGTLTDITERKKSEEALKESENKYRTLMQQLPVGVYRTTPDGQFIYFNESLAQMLGYETEELQKINVADLYLNKKEREEELKQLKKTRKGIKKREIKLITRQGQIIIVNDIVNAVYDDEGNMKYFDGVLEDITDKKETENALKESEEKFRRLAQTTSTAIMVYQGTKWVYANPAAEKISGFSEEELVQMNFWDIVAPEHQEMIKNRGKQRQESAEVPSGYEFKIINKKGQEKWVYLEGSKTEYNGSPAGLISVIDITSIKNTENQLKERNAELQAAEEELIASNSALKEINQLLEEQKEELEKAKDKAEESDRLKSAFLANMSHEIRTPLNGIAGFVDLLQNQKFSDEEQKEFFEIIHSNTNHLLQIINDIIDISKIEANQLDINKTSVNINKVLNELHKRFSLDIKKNKEKQKNIEFNLSMELEDKKSYVLTDEIRLKQILSNLISNALKFTSKGMIEAGYTLEEKKKVILFFVKDTGIGIDNKHLETIFDHFRRGDESKSSHFGGTGLGLSISKKLTEMLGGKIWVESNKGKGSAFYFTLPYQ